VLVADAVLVAVEDDVMDAERVIVEDGVAIKVGNEVSNRVVVEIVAVREAVCVPVRVVEAEAVALVTVGDVVTERALEGVNEPVSVGTADASKLKATEAGWNVTGGTANPAATIAAA